ncbi:MAG: DUF397 domain-containing protein [Actinobacteria bacterium]|nr:DUF397 domain-containing protein [Actinomycetota bacterium]
MGQPIWRRSSFSTGEGNCVEVAELDGRQHVVRDSKDPAGPVLVCTTDEWAAFTASIRAGEFA